jgi:3-dehydroquinate dehydratase-1/3-dehydroquinate dehydratase/shikimate dehydrogenase
LKLRIIQGDKTLQVSLDSPAGVCVSVACKNEAEAVDIALRSEPNADIIEIRLDHLGNPAIETFARRLSRPLLFTNRPTWEGGAYEGSEGERVGLLIKAVESDCGLVDLELQTAPELRAELLDVLLQHSGTALIVSWHDFTGTPASEELGDILHQQIESGAHIGKIVTMANSQQDVLRVLNLLSIAAENNFPLIAFCMGHIGMISRVATMKLGGYMTYAAPDNGKESAPGQLEVSALRNMLKTLALEA